MQKINSRKTTIDGFKFDSRTEAYRYLHLKQRLKSEEINQLELQPPFVLRGYTGRFIMDYTADFKYFDTKLNKLVIEDVKGVYSRELSLKKRMFEACYDYELVFVIGKLTGGRYQWTSHKAKKKQKDKSSHKSTTGTLITLANEIASVPNK